MADIFQVSAPASFRRAVPIYAPDGGERAIDIEWVWMDAEDLKQWTQAMKTKPEIATLAKAIHGWHGVIDETGKAVNFTADSLAWLCAKFPSAPLHLFLGYCDAMTDGRIKN